MKKNMMTRLLGVVFVVALIAAACGGDDDSATATGSGDAAEASDEGADDGTSDGDASDEQMAPAGEDGDGEDHHDESDADMDHHEDDDDDDDGHGDDGDHDHGDSLEVPEGMAVPEADVSISADPVKGQNLRVELTNFTVAPENASTEPVDGEGHLHLYVDGERVLRFYNEWLHLALEPGDHTVEVEVSANDHRAYAVDGQAIRGSASITVEEPEESHSHAEAVEVEADGAPSVTVEVFEDPKSGWNIHAVTENFVITPENSGLDHVEGEGHLHLLADGVRVTRLYGNWWHLAKLTQGEHLLTVEVAANNHHVYAVDGEPIVGTATVSVPTEKATPEEPGGGDDGHGGDHDADLTVEIGFSSGVVDVEDDRIPVDRGSVVALMITSDVDEHVHVHGYDIFVDISAGETAMVVFDADVPGVFEVEFEDSVTFITELQVS